MAAFRDIFTKLFASGTQPSVTLLPSSGTQMDNGGFEAKQGAQRWQASNVTRSFQSLSVPPKASQLSLSKTEQEGQIPSVLASLQSSLANSAPTPISPLRLPRSTNLGRLADPAIQASARKCMAKLGEKPTDEQWEMILSPTASTCVIAGAGSGKSATLILRLLVIHKLLGISLDELHVFSFTRASTREFQEKLKKKLHFWEEQIEGKSLSNERRKEIEEQVKRTVSTFHSVIARLCQDVLPGGSLVRNFFDVLGSKEIEEEAVQGSYNPFVNPNLSHEQSAILNAAHINAYRENATYRTLLQKILAEQERQFWLRAEQEPDPGQALEESKWWAFLFQEQRYHGFVKPKRGPLAYDPEPCFRDRKNYPYIDPYRAAIADQLYEWNVPFSPLSAFGIRSPLVGQRPGAMYAAFQVGSNLFLHVHRSRRYAQISSQERSTFFHERDRRRFIALYLQGNQSSDQHKIFTPADFEREKSADDGRVVLTSNGLFKLERCLNLSGHALELSAPVFRVKLPGDLRAQHIAELFYQEGTFLESLGVEVEDFLAMDRQLDPISQAIAIALPLFWQSFTKELEQRDLVRFHDVLRGLRRLDTLRKLQGKLKHLRHLFIDEFQDISPEVVDWLSKTLAVHSEATADVSVTVIGDDSQAIYGWRGSHPLFLMNFDHYFSTVEADQSGKVLLRKNFRSRQPIIDAAEASLAPIQDTRKILKHGQSSSAHLEQGLPSPVKLIETQLSWDRNSSEGGIWQTFSLFATALLSKLEMGGQLAYLRKGKERFPLVTYILARTNATLEAIVFTSEQLRSQLLAALSTQGITSIPDVQVRCWTFHKSKGLEADLVLLLDDIQSPEVHPLRELAFSQSPFLGGEAETYVQLMNDECRRLAYVALTRARLGVMWVPLVQLPQPAANNDHVVSSKRNGPDLKVSDKGSFILVQKHLQEQGQNDVP